MLVREADYKDQLVKDGHRNFKQDVGFSLMTLLSASFKKIGPSVTQNICDDDSGLLGCDTVSLGEWFLLFWRRVVPSSSRVKQSNSHMYCDDCVLFCQWSLPRTGHIAAEVHHQYQCSMWLHLISKL